jgi:hypothetical protein
MPSKSERERRLRLFQVHADAENDRDIDAIMATFAPDAVMVFNEIRFTDPVSIRIAHMGFGMSAVPAGLEGVRQEHERIRFSDNHVLVEGRVVAKHVAPLFGYPPSNQQVEMFYTAAYLFNQADLLISEHVVMNWAPITLPYALSLAPAARSEP